ncbi:MAG: hypothetical protein CMD83_18135 [Gammaproteobacteria bacterium]|nr:hypothetical protein [Gammaproteobacteria bacterium]
MLREKKKSKRGKFAIGDFHLAGIVPVTGEKLDFNMPWHDSLVPIAQNYLAIEHAVYECACAGANTIWVVCKEGTTPLIRHRLGDWIFDPVEIDSISKNPRSKQKDHIRRIPIYYVKLKPIDFERRESLGWSVLTGAINSFRMSYRVSKWLIPDKYFVSFPYGIYDVNTLRMKRRFFRNNHSYVLTHQGKSVADGLFTGFTFDRDVFVYARREIRKYKTTLDEVFKSVRMDEPREIELDWYYPIDSWENYKKYLSSEHAVEKNENIANGITVFQKEKYKREYTGIGRET